MNVSTLDISSGISASAQAIAEALGITEYESLNGVLWLYTDSSHKAGFAIGLSNKQVFAVYNGNFTDGSGNILDTLGNTLYYVKKDNFTLFGSSASGSTLCKGFVKGHDANGVQTLGCFSKSQGSTYYGFIWDKDTDSYGSTPLNNAFCRAGYPAFSLVLCPIFNEKTGFYADDGAYFVARMPSSLAIAGAQYAIAMGDAELALWTNGTNVNYFNFAFDVTE